MTSQPQDPGTALATVEKLPITAQERRAIADAVSVWGGNFTSLEKLPPEDLARVARVIITAFPDFTALDCLTYFDVLGGKLRETAEFWIHMGSRHPAFAGMETERIRPGSGVWDEWLPGQDPAHIAAAYLCRVWRSDRPRPMIECNYVMVADPMLFDYRFESLGNRANKEAAIAEASARGYPERSDVFFVNKNGGYWAAKWSEPVLDLQAKAAKKARTTAAGRTFKKAFSRLEAKLSTVLRQLEKTPLVSAGGGDSRHAPAQLVQGVGAIRGAGAPTAPIRSDRYDEGEPPAARRATAPAAIETPVELEPHDPPPATEQRDVLPEAERRHLYSLLTPRNISLLGVDSDHEALHAIIRKVRGLGPDAKVSTRDVLYSELEAVVAEIDALPFEDAQPKEEETTP